MSSKKLKLEISELNIALLRTYLDDTDDFHYQDEILEITENAYLELLIDPLASDLLHKIPRYRLPIKIDHDGILMSESGKIFFTFDFLNKKAHLDYRPRDPYYIYKRDEKVYYVSFNLFHCLKYAYIYNNEKDISKKRIAAAEFKKYLDLLAEEIVLDVDRIIMDWDIQILDEPKIEIQKNDDKTFDVKVLDEGVSEEDNEELKNKADHNDKFVATKKNKILIPTEKWKKIEKITKKHKRVPEKDKEKVLKEVEEKIREESEYDNEKTEKILDGWSERICGFGFKSSKLIRCFENEKNDWFNDDEVYDVNLPSFAAEDDSVVSIDPKDVEKVLDLKPNENNEDHFLELEKGKIKVNNDDLNVLKKQIEQQLLNEDIIKRCSKNKLEEFKEKIANVEGSKVETVLNGIYIIGNKEELLNRIDLEVEYRSKDKESKPKEKTPEALIKENELKLDYEIHPVFKELYKDEIRPPRLLGHIRLKNYQVDGVRRLMTLYNPDSVGGCLLADDMGLGKSLQILSFIDIIQSIDKNKKHLIVVPKTLLRNWLSEIDDKGEINKFFDDSLKRNTMIADSPARIRQIKAFLTSGGEIVLTTYDYIANSKYEEIFFKDCSWETVTFDEAQWVKNHSSKRSKAAKKFKAKFVITCSATPIENDLAELWNLIDISVPGYLGSLAGDFKKNIKSASEAGEEAFNEYLKSLKTKIDKISIRRMKADVEDLDLPAKRYHLCQMGLSNHQVNLSNLYVHELAIRGMSGINMMKYLLVHPFLTQKTESINFIHDIDGVLNSSPKLDWLTKLIDGIIEKDESLLIFTRMIRIQEFIQTLLLKKYGEKIWLERLFGKTPAKMKEKLINEFKEHNGTAVFILSPDVAGVGITLTEANNVVHLDRLWNPAKEDQATDRTYRIGQEKDVNVYLPITTLIDDKKTHIYEGQKEFIKRVYEKGEDQTVDEIIDGILKDKSNLAANFFGYIPQTSKNDQNVVLSKFAKRAEKKVEFDLETLPESLFLPLLGAYLIKTYGSKIMIGPEENDRGFNLIEKRNDQVLIYKMIDNVDELDSIKLKGESSDFADLLNVNPTIGVLSTSKSKKSFFKGLFDKTKDIEKLELPNIFTSDLVRHAVKLNALNRVEKIEHLAIDEPYKYTIILDGKKFYKSQPWKQLRYEVIAEFSNKHRNEGTKEACMACGQTGKEWHVDHIKPRSKYPHLALSIENLQVLCKNCNEGKSNLREDDFR